MKTRTLMPVALACALLVSAVAQAAPLTVYGNLGANGQGNLTSGGLDYGPGFPNFAVLAHGFTTGSDLDTLAVTAIKLGLFSTNAISRNLSIYSNSDGNPGSVVATSSSVSVEALGVYTFNFTTPVSLAAATTYWIVPQPSATQDLFWQNADDGMATAQNGSGYQFVSPNGTKSSATGIEGPWTTRNGGVDMAVSIEVAPVPEPSSIALAGMGIVVAGLSVRRRMRRTVSTAATETT